MDDQTIAEIAGKLTPTQGRALVRGWGTVCIARRLRDKGLVAGCLGQDPRWLCIVATDLGEKVRTYLQEQGNE